MNAQSVERLSSCFSPRSVIPPDTLQLTDAKPVDPAPRPGQYKIPGTEGGSGGKKKRGGRRKKISFV